MTVYRAEVDKFSTDGIVISGDFTPGDVISLRPGARIVIVTEQDAEKFL
ncbi:Uncharacterised protein [Mycobacteroides abscessus subsp. massiliense]|nr:hypothetical protein [Mycobacteroides abscessus]SKD36256.1 Uncharacterised protein [Mycobacteroides abscessus subsp. massiliense]SKD36496.1 Uncharacterised protein [Mycobacteroides abscessus subsp. massiliense]SKD47149.1 Uncharacterised protein [Mycobacteroides abscessus subsp. massiliense]SKD49702.1 Uncharacterised protein [Mycobacteroides abscessus subsp. massiliense]SKD58988.1 Uncharacterised protein [Mycobacteroides abscessus subsp. massiliense]